MASSLADAEAALAANRTPEVLAVYGDALQSLGDPRGELIAIDLHVAAHGANAELAVRKRELIDGWLGAELAARVLAIGAVEHGFIDIPWGLAADEVERMLAHPGLHAALRTFAFEDSDSGLCRALDLVCATPPPWLEALHVVRYPDGLDPENRDAIAVDDGRARRLVDATPRLRKLTLAGANVVAELVHPGVRELRLYNYDALGSVLRGGPPLPALVEVDLQFFDDPSAGTLATMLPPACFPVLRRLDLARNEARSRGHAFALVAANPIVRQLAWLRLPSVRSDADLDVLERAVATMPADAEVIVARAHVTHLPVRAPSPRIRVPRPRPWPPTDANHGRLTVVIPGERQGTTINLREAIALMEAQFDALPDAERATWLELWRGVNTLTPEGRFELSGGALDAAVAALELTEAHASWTGLRLALAKRTDDTVQIRRWSLWA